MNHKTKTLIMRKLLFSALVLSTTLANAQSGTTETKKLNLDAVKSFKPTPSKGYKPTAGTVTAEFGLSGGLLNSNLGLNNNAGLLRFRYFLQDDFAVRIGFSVTNKSETKNVYAPAGPLAGLQGSLVNKNSGLAVNLGAEKHFKGSDRLSTYVGADLLFFSNNATEKRENTVNGTTFQQGFNGERKGTNSVGDATSGIGFRLITGAEYYFVKNVYIGGELGFGFQSLKFKAITGQSTTFSPLPAPNGTSTTVAIDIKSPGKSSAISPSVITGVRIGFQF
jgi:hypothetical protein